jgi:hypothetical protein
MMRLFNTIAKPLAACALEIDVTDDGAGAANAPPSPGGAYQAGLVSP